MHDKNSEKNILNSYIFRVSTESIGRKILVLLLVFTKHWLCTKEQSLAQEHKELDVVLGFQIYSVARGETKR